MRPEETIEKKFVDECWKIGIKSIKLEVNGEKGWPDQMVLLPSARVMFFEFKRPDGKGEPSLHQVNTLMNLVNLDFIAMIVDSWETPLAMVKEYIKLNEDTMEKSKIIMPGDTDVKH